MKKEKRLSVELEPQMHSDIKKIAIDKGLSLKQWIVEAIVDKVKKDQDLGFSCENNLNSIEDCGN